jgi:HAMP domain-containing protein
MLKNLKLGTKFTLILVIVFVGGLIVSGTVLYQILQQRAQSEVASKSTMLIETMNSVRTYSNNSLNPLLTPIANASPIFIPELIPTHAINTVFENLRKNDEYKSYFYKDAFLDPTNLRDKADPFEEDLIRRFINDSNTKEITGFRDQPGGRIFYIARPFIIKKSSCLQCHSTPEVAPKNLIATYGKENGFHWELNKVLGTQIITIPVDEVYDSANSAWWIVFGILAVIFGLLLVVINLLLKRTVTQRISRMAQTADAVSTGSAEANFTEDAGDEIGTLAVAFNRMKSSLDIALKMLSSRD